MSELQRGARNQGPLQAGNHRVAPLICYEIVYPDLAARSARNAELLVTISNDSWFGAPSARCSTCRWRACAPWKTAATCCAAPTTA
jgi:apolipoprotein N-acyltransferase